MNLEIHNRIGLLLQLSSYGYIMYDLLYLYALYDCTFTVQWHFKQWDNKTQLNGSKITVLYDAKAVTKLIKYNWSSGIVRLWPMAEQ